MAMNLPISIATYGQERTVLKNRRQRRAKVLRPDFTPAGRQGRTQDEIEFVPAALLSFNTPKAAPATKRPAMPTLPSLPSSGAKGTHATYEASVLAESSLTQAILLDWLGQQPVAFHRVYVDISGSVSAAVWLSMALSRMTSADTQGIDVNGIYQFTLATAQCKVETGLTQLEQHKAHRQLSKVGILSFSYPDKNEENPNATPSPSFKLDLERLTALVLSQSEGMAEMVRRSGAQAPSVDVQALERQAQERAKRRSV
jgi:hypothetical protein